MITSNQLLPKDGSKPGKDNAPSGGRSMPSRTIVHPKLEMTTPESEEEREANAVASDIVAGGKLARSISGGGQAGGIAVSSQMESQLGQLQGQGQPMPEALRGMMERGFGRDFSQVRLHTDGTAAEMSSSISAKAFTHGNDIYFGRGQYSPSTTEGQQLVAHELTHVAQNSQKVARDPDKEATTQQEKQILMTQDEIDLLGKAHERISWLERITEEKLSWLEEHLSSLVSLGPSVIKSMKSMKSLIKMKDVIIGFLRMIPGLAHYTNEKLAEYRKQKRVSPEGDASTKTQKAPRWFGRGINLTLWAATLIYDILRVDESTKKSNAEFVYYLMRSYLTLADCPICPWPKDVKLFLFVVNTSSALGDLYGMVDNEWVHPHRRAEMVADFYGGPDSVGGVLGYFVGSLPALGEAGEGIGTLAAMGWLGITED